MTHPFLHEAPTACSPESVVETLRGEPGVVLLRSALASPVRGRYSLVVARPFLRLRCFGTRCELAQSGSARVQFGNPWQILNALLGRYELLDELDLPFPLGGCFGYWGYDLKHFLEPRLRQRAVNDLELPDCHVGFYDSLVVFDHLLGRSWIVATGLDAHGTVAPSRARQQAGYWREVLQAAAEHDETPVLRARSPASPPDLARRGRGGFCADQTPSRGLVAGRDAYGWAGLPLIHSPDPLGSDRVSLTDVPGSSFVLPGLASAGPVRANFSREGFVAAIERAQRYIRAGDIYQVNLSQRLVAPWSESGWQLFQRLAAVSPAPFAAYLDGGDFQVVSSSPELFLRLSGTHIHTRPIKGTRPRAADPDRDAQLSYDLQTSAKEMAELVMITDLLRNDLGKVCEYGSVRVPELVRLERYAQVQHLVSTVEGRLRPGVTHLDALAACFPGGSITGAPKIRAMEIIEELEPTTRGPYTGCLGYLGFNRESQLSIIIRTALCLPGTACFHVGAGIVADSATEAEHAETLAKAQGFLAALEWPAWAVPQVVK